MSAAEAGLEHRILKPRMATAESLAGYGTLMTAPELEKSRESGFYAEAVRISEPAAFVSQDDICLALATLNPRPLEVRWMEYHNKHTQTFIPLDGKPIVMVLGRPTCRRADGTWDEAAPRAPELEDIEAFAFDGSAGMCLNIGTWHEFPFPLQEATNVIVVMSEETKRDLKNTVAGEAHGGDLEKLDLQKRFGVVFEVQV
jgi:ureidoglycolate lyase